MSIGEKNEELLCDALVEMCRIFTKEHFEDSLLISIRDIRQGSNEEVVVDVEGRKYCARFESISMLTQEKISDYEQSMFGYFGDCEVQGEIVEEELKAALELNAQLVTSNGYSRLDAIHLNSKDEILLKKIHEVLGNRNRINVRECEQELFIHAELDLKQITPRSVLFELIAIACEKLEPRLIHRIQSVQLPYAYFGSIRICVKSRGNGMIDAILFNSFGSRVGKIEGIDTSIDEKQNLESILREMQVLKEHHTFEEMMSINLPMIGIDSIRIAELENLIFTKMSKKVDLFGMHTLEQVLEKVRQTPESGITNGAIMNIPRIPLSSQQKRILFHKKVLDTNLRESCVIRFKDPVKFKNALNRLIMEHTILRTFYKTNEQEIGSGTEAYLTIGLDSREFEGNIGCQRIDEESFRLMFDHIAIDGRGLSLFYDEFRRLLNGSSAFRARQYFEYCLERPLGELSFWESYIPRGGFEEIDLEPCSRPFVLKERIDKYCSLDPQLSPFEHFSSLIQILFAKETNRNRFALGFAVDLRGAVYINTIGCFTNLLPLCVSLEPSQNLHDHCINVMTNIRKLREHAGTPFEKLVNIAQLNGASMHKHPLFQILLVDDVVQGKRVRFEDDIGLEWEPVEDPSPYEQIWYLRRQRDGSMWIEVVCKSGETLCKNVIKGLSRLMASPCHRFQSIEDLMLEVKEERSQQFSDYPKNFFRIWEEYNGFIEDARDKLSANNLMSNVQRLAIFLKRKFLEKYGTLIQDAPVLIKLARNVKLVEAVLACWKAGFYPVPVTSQKLLEQVIEELNQPHLLLDVESVRRDKQERGRLWNSMSDIVYVTCTSGSTGKPKMVVTSMEGHANLMTQYTKNFLLSSRDRVCQVVDPSFDIFFADLLKTLTNGCDLLLCSESIFKPHEIERCSNAYVMPAFLARLDDSLISSLANLQTIQFGGEPLPSSAFRKINAKNPRLRLFQEYGLTELTVYSTWQRVKLAEHLRTIGIAHDNIRMKVVDGELLISGVGVMRGYFGATSRVEWVRTGDVVKEEKQSWRLVGRKDSQVKVRGHRVQLIEIEWTAQKMEGVNSCACFVIDGQLALAFVSKVNLEKELQEHMEQQLESHKQPAKYYWMIADFPLTRTGKVDRKKVLQLIQNNKKDIKARIIHWLAHFSNGSTIGLDDDIFRSGIDSITVMMASQRLLADDGIDIPPKLFFKHRRVANIASAVLGELRNNDKPPQIPLNHIQERILFLSRMNPSAPIFRMSFDLSCAGIEIETLARIVNKLVMGNILLRSDVIVDKYCFETRSATESFYLVKEHNANEVVDDIEVSLARGKLRLNINHIYCDGRSLDVIKEQFEKLLKDQDVRFENNFDSHFRQKIEDVENSTSTIFPQFHLGCKTRQRKILNVPQRILQEAEAKGISLAHAAVFFYATVLAKAFQLNQVTIGITFMNRDNYNWNTVDMLANTLPVVYDGKDGLEEYSEKIWKVSGLSDRRLVGGSFDFGFNLHKSEQAPGYSQFPIMGTLVGREIVIDFDEIIENDKINNIAETEHSIVEKVFTEILQKNINTGHFFQSGGHSLLAMKAMDRISQEYGKKLPLRLIFENPTSTSLTNAIEQYLNAYSFPLSPQQSQMLYLAEMTEPLEYQLPFIQVFPVSIKESLIHEALLHLIQYQSIYRSVISSDLRQTCRSITECFLPMDVVQVEGEDDLRRRIVQECAQVIKPIGDGPPIRIRFIRGKSRCVAFLHLHHVISDARSTQITNAFIEDYVKGKGINWKRGGYSYFDYCKNLDGGSQGTLGRDLLKQLKQGVEGRWEAKGTSERVFQEIPKKQVDELVRKNSTTPFVVFAHALASKVCESFEQVNITFPNINRDEMNANVCGYYLNNLVIPVDRRDNLANIGSKIAETVSMNIPFYDVHKQLRYAFNQPFDSLSSIYLNCRYDLEFDESDDDELLSLVPMKLHFPLELDVDQRENCYRFTLRTNAMNYDEARSLLDSICSAIYSKKPSSIKGQVRDVPRFCLRSSPTIRQAFIQAIGSAPRADDVIGVVARPSKKAIEMSLAVQATGPAYLPIDSRYPVEKIEQMLGACLAYVSDGSYLSPNHILIKFQEDSHLGDNLRSPQDIAYIIATSGTTGTPKLSAICGEGVANMCAVATNEFFVNSSSCVYQFTSFSFDNSVLEYSLALANQCHMVHPKAPGTFDAYEVDEATHCLLFPSLVESIGPGSIGNIPYWIVGGEKLPTRLLCDALRLGVRVYQNYGPTETTAFALTSRMRCGDEGNKIGRPIANMEVMVREDGELWIRGIGMMRGYLDRDGLREHGGCKWYASGDIGRIDDGQVYYEHRNDSQVKVRGFRVELSEIEKLIEDHPKVRKCKTLFNPETQQIHSFITSSEQISDLRSYCSSRLEPHKIPSIFTFLNSFPLTTNSKIDTKALLAKPIELNNETNQRMSTIWKTCLHTTNDPNNDDHFYLVGGHSLLLIRLRYSIENEFKVQIPLSQLLMNLKFNQMVQMVEKLMNKVTFIIFPALYGGCAPYHKLKEKLERIGEVYLLEEETGDTVEDISSKYKSQIEKLGNRDRLVHVGASAAGTFAYETGRLIKDKVVQVVLLDAGSYYDLIASRDYNEHKKEVIEHLTRFGIDKGMALDLSELAWKILQVLRSYRPETSHNAVHVLSLDGSDLGWKRFTNVQTISQISGDHYSMLFDDMNVNVIYNTIERIFNNK